MPIAVENINKNYKRGRKKAEVLRGVSLSVTDGAFACIVGPSGSGKSTLLRIMGGLMKPTSGTVTVNDEDLYKKSDRKLSKYRNQTIGFVFQDYRLIPHYSVIENVKVPVNDSFLAVSACVVFVFFVAIPGMSEEYNLDRLYQQLLLSWRRLLYTGCLS